ncbi:uncharacterized protein E0L32_003753 [Thyridium curvatum]|uniref:Zn(2)-C6 fungal-type domain-containing protein n=1 Tax=Thyridium curvatum TaxID=1093900 RepID=A0A507BGK5_9PEZI|nr:uncharacterized protein E0L32_003753 [Thyridium curvatum]TPX16459.1 hypothetical protein E0L32_003753 [Thyridium curvatum]
MDSSSLDPRLRTASDSSYRAPNSNLNNIHGADNSAAGRSFAAPSQASAEPHSATTAAASSSAVPSRNITSTTTRSPQSLSTPTGPPSHPSVSVADTPATNPSPRSGAAPNHDDDDDDEDEDDNEEEEDRSHDHGVHDSPSQAAVSALLPAGAGDPKKPRACEACRGLKVRCDPDPANPDGPCKRCAKAGRSCVVTQPTRKRQKKTDSRVAELEKKIDALTQSLQASRGAAAATVGGAGGGGGGVGGGLSSSLSLGGGGLRGASAGDDGHDAAGRLMPARTWSTPPSREHAPPPPPLPQSTKTHRRASPYGSISDRSATFPPPPPPPMVMAGQKRKHVESRDSQGPEDVKDVPPSVTSGVGSLGHEYTDIVDRGIISMEKAVELFYRYTEKMSPHLPAVIFPEGTTAAEIRKSKPTLFHAIMAAASSELPNVQRAIVKELQQIFADKIVVAGEKSLELVQALQVAVIWYWPPEHFEELKFYQFVHMAAIMSIDIGLGRKKSGRHPRHVPYAWRDHPFKKHPPPDPCSIEARRAWLACYYLTTNTSMALHRPNLLRWSPFMAESLEVLKTSPEAVPSDKYLAHLVWSHKLSEDIGYEFQMDDPSAVISLADRRTQYALKGFEHELEKFWSSLSKQDIQPSLRLGIHVVSLYMHEIVMQAEDDPRGEELPRPPYSSESMQGYICIGALTPAHINALSECLTAIHGVFDTFLSLDVAVVRCMPVFNFVRIAYATVVLIKMYFAVTAPDSELGSIISREDMDVERHLERLLDKFRATAAEDRSRPAAKFLVVLVMIRSWFQKQGGAAAAVEGRPVGASSAAHQKDGATASTTTTMIGAPPHLQQQQQQQQRGSFPSSANTPLHLLSEIATNDGAAATATPSGNSLAAAANATSMAAPLPPWLSNIQTPQPFTYDGTSNTAAALSARGDQPRGSGGAGTAAAAAAAGGAGGSFGSLAQQQQQMNMPWLGLGTDFDYSNLGDGFAQAMDMTLAEMNDSGFNLQEDGIRLVMNEPWFSGGMFFNGPS